MIPVSVKTPMLNAFDLIRLNPTAKIFEVGGLLFAQFECPEQDNPVGIWTEMDHLLHVLSAKSTWRTCTGTCSAMAGETVFFKKGAYILPQHFEKDLCVEIFFIPDAFITEMITELAADLPEVSERVDSREPLIRVNHDTALSAFFHAMTLYFASDAKPPEALLKLKLKELITSILVGDSNPILSAYLRSFATLDAPLISTIMERNFYHNLPLTAFAQMCHRSLSSFKREFQTQYGISPRKWLLDRRLKRSASLLQTTGMSITKITFECGFEDVSHFSRAFKKKFGLSPRSFRETPGVTA